jgi:hypothetical protein
VQRRGFMIKQQREYKAYLQSGHWRNLRQQAFDLWGRKCFKCGAEKELHVHHLNYGNGDLHAVKVADLRPVCEPCHRVIHGHRKKTKAEWKTAKRAKKQLKKIQRLESRLCKNPFVHTGRKKRKTPKPWQRPVMNYETRLAEIARRWEENNKRKLA